MLIEFLSDNGSGYTAKETKASSKLLNLETRTTVVKSPQNNGMAESFVKKMKRDYISVMLKPNKKVALQNLAIAFEHYNEKHRLCCINIFYAFNQVKRLLPTT